jgi:hypothetical protein
MENKKISLYIIGILAVLIIAMFFWRFFSVRGLEKEMIEQQTSFTQKTQQLMAENTSQFLRLTMVSLVWVVRKEMLQENYGQINEYLTNYVKERNIQQIVLVKADGVIAVATDKRIEGAEAASVFPPQIFEQEGINITEDENANLRVVAPIMGLNARLGSLVLIYKPEIISLGTK